MHSNHPRHPKKNSTYQSYIPTSSRVPSPQTRIATDAPPSASFARSSPSIDRLVSRSQAINPLQQTIVATDFTDNVNLNSSSVETHTHAYPPQIPIPNLRPSPTNQAGFARATDPNSLGTTAQTAFSMQSAMTGNPRDIHGTSRLLERKRPRHSAQGAITPLSNSNPSQPLDSSAYRNLASSSSSVVATSEHVYPAHTGASFLSESDFDYAPRQDSNIASFNQYFASASIPPANYSQQQHLSSDVMEWSEERLSIAVSETLDPNGNPLPNISIAQPLQPPPFETVAAFPGVVVPEMPFKPDFFEEAQLLTDRLITGSHPSVIPAFPALLSPISPSQASSVSATEDVGSDEELPIDVPQKPKRNRKRVERKKAIPSENKYRKELRDRLLIVGNALTSLPEEIKPEDFKGKDGSFKPSKGKTYDGCLQIIETATTLYSELQRKDNELQRKDNELQQAKEELAHLKRQLQLQLRQQQQQQQQHAVQHSSNFNLDTKSFHLSGFPQNYSPNMITQ